MKARNVNLLKCSSKDVSPRGAKIKRRKFGHGFTRIRLQATPPASTRHVALRAWGYVFNFDPTRRPDKFTQIRIRRHVLRGAEKDETKDIIKGACAREGQKVKNWRLAQRRKENG